MLTIYREGLSASSACADLIAGCVAKKERCILLVPEQQTVLAEATLARLLPSDAPLFFEVSNFTRLANTAFRMKGGLSYRYATPAASALMMWKTLDALLPLLSASSEKKSTIFKVKELLRANNEMYALGISPEDLSLAAKRLSQEEQLGRRIQDLSTVLSVFRGALREKYGTAAEDLDSLYHLLAEHPLFEDTHFFIQGFTSFTMQQYRIIEELLRASALSVFLPYPVLENKQLCFLEEEDTYRTLVQTARKIGVSYQTETLPATAHKVFAFAEENLFRADRAAPSFKEKNGDFFRFYSASTPFEAADDIAVKIKRLVQEENARYRDFTVIARKGEDYRGILDTAFEKYGIPFFMSERTDLSAFEIIKMISSAYAILCYGYQRSDVITYMKCRFAGINDEDADIFELYTEKLGIHGALLAKEEDLTLNPDGYTASLSERGAFVLERVNDVKKRLFAPLHRLEEAIKGGASAKTHAEALFRLLEDIHAEEQLQGRAERALLEGRRAEGQILSRLFQTICDTLDTVVENLEEETLSTEQFSEILSLLFATVDLGQIPVSEDAVLIGSADMLRAETTPFVFLMGANEGEFPSEIHDSGFFHEAERDRLKDAGLTLANDLSIRASREQFCFLRAIALGQEAVFLHTFRFSAAGAPLRPSAAYTRLLGLYEDAKEENASSLPLEERIYNARSADEYRFVSRGTSLAEAIDLATGEDSLPEVPVADLYCHVSEELAQALFPDRMHLTQSRIDKYVDCPFAYYGSYILRLDDNNRVKMDSLSIGNLIHALLEAFLDLSKKEGKEIGSMDNESLRRLMKKAAKAYEDAVFPQEKNDFSPHLKHLLIRLQRSAFLMAEELNDEFAESDFKPIFWELSMGEEGAPDPLVFPITADKKISIHGKIDRVDAYKDEEGTVYLRVVDYKTGAKTFSLEKLKSGRNVQLPLYLFSLWKSRNPAFLKELGISPEDKVLPAGAFYMLTSPKGLRLGAPLDEAEVRQRAQAELTRNGFVLDDEKVLYAMEHSASRYTKQGKDGVRKPTGPALSATEMGELAGTLADIVTGIGSRMQSGEACATPASPKEAGRDPCDFCSMKPFCRKTKVN